MTILFSNSSPKTHKSGIFGPKFRHFCFFVKQANLRVLISNLTIVFLKFLLKNTQIRHFWSQIQAFLFLHKILQFHQIEGADFKYDNSFLKFQPFLSQIQTFSLFHDILQFYKFQGADFKYDNIFSNFSRKIPESHNFGPKFRHFCFFAKFAIRQI